MYNQRKSKSWGQTDRISFADAEEAYTTQYSNNVFNGAFGFGRFGLDYFIDNRNTISVSQSIVNGDFKFDNRTNTNIDTASGGFESQYRNTTGKNNFRNYGTQVTFKHLFARAGKEWTADLNFNQSKNTNFSDIRYRSFYDVDQLEPKSGEQFQTIDGGGETSSLLRKRIM